MVQPDQTRQPVDRLAAEIRRMQARLDALERGGARVPILDEDPAANDPINLWMFNDGRLRGRDAENRVREWVNDGFALNFNGGWGATPPGAGDGVAFTLDTAGVLRGMASATAWSPTDVNLIVLVYIDQVEVCELRLSASHPTTAHLALPVRAFEINVNAGTHRIYYQLTSGSSDSGDFGAAFGVVSPRPALTTSTDTKPAVATPHLHQATWTVTDTDCCCPVHGVEGPLYFGQLDATHGERRLMFAFDYANIQATLAGATIQQVELSARTLESYQTTGVEIAWGGHAEAGLGGTYHQEYEDVWRDTWPQVGGDDWRVMPRWFGDALRDGDITGLVVNQPSTSKAFYGRLDPALSLRITYSHAH